MTVYRRGIEPEATKPTRTSLGRVLMTIDDLEALLDLLATKSESGTRPNVDFRGGYIDKAEDLRNLSDDELKWLRIATPELEIVLASNLAECVGDEKLGEWVYRSWARTRQTKQAPRGSLTFTPAGMVPFTDIRVSHTVRTLLFAVGSVAMLVGVIWAAIDPNQEPPTNRDITISLVFGVTGVLLLITAGLLRAVRRPATFTTVVPATLPEYRSTQNAGRRHLQTAVIALGGLVVALTGLIVTILLK